MVRNKLDSYIQLLIPPSLVLLMVITIIELFYNISLLTSFIIDVFDIYVIIIFGIDLYFRWQEERKFWPYLAKYWLDIIATIPFGFIFFWIDGLALLQGFRGVRSVRGIFQSIKAARALRAAGVVRVVRVGRLARFARYGRLLRLLRFGARAPRFLRSRKHVKEAKIRKVQPHEKEMHKTLSFKVILLITINSIMGTGIWFLTAAGAKHAGPASLISWGILSVISVYIAMCFAELTSMFPKAGGVYEFAKQTYGRFWSFVLGWTTSIAGSVTIAMLLLGALQYLIPLEYAYMYVPLAIGLIMLFSLVAYRGMQTSTVVLVTFALITLTAVTSIIVPGFFSFEPGNFAPFFVFPTMNIVLAIFFIAETFFGWESAIFLSAETKNPTKIMPKALIYGTVVIAILAFLLSLTAMGKIPWQQYAESVAPLRDLGEAYFGITGRIIFTFLIFVSVIGATAGWIVTAPRLLMSIAEDKLFFTQFARIHPKHKSPYVSIAFQAVVVSLLVVVGAGKYETLLHMLIPLILLVYSAVMLSVVILRFKRPELHRPYKVIFGKAGPFATILFMIFLLIMFIRETHGALDILRISGSLIVFGIPAYFAIELFYEEKYVALRRNLMARLAHHIHWLSLSPFVLARLVSHVKPVSAQTDILAMSLPVAGFTRKVVPFRTVHLASMAAVDLAFLKNRIKGRKDIILHTLRTIKVPSVKNIDVFLSYNDLGYVKDIPSFLRQVKRSLHKNGRFCFYIKNGFFNMTPNALLVENKEEILALCSKAGLKASYQMRRGFMKTEHYVYGKVS